ncbi:uncharacterized protein LOC135153983 [Lytechinus pictus]|uniref:uncharacterized protein LOC135153983 n=1 Tax=Lytechinus pictus TaxID=7653 RepID=UPI0030BA0239
MAITSIIYVIVLLESIFHAGQCEYVSFLCGARQERSLGAVDGRNVSVQFLLEDPLNENQSIVWAKWVDEKNQLLDDVDKETINRDRYKLTNVAGERTINLSIAFSEPSDSGEYVLKIHHKDQKLCTIASFNITIESTEPVCSTLYDQETRRLQMSCEWMQVNVGDQVQLLVGDQVLYEYGTSDMNIDGDFNSTNIFSVYSSIEDVHNGRVMPSVCLINNKDKSNNNTCSFHFVQDLRLHSFFECCPEGETDADVLWYTNGSILIPLSPNNTVSFVHEGRLSLFCGPGVPSKNKTVLLRNIGNFIQEKECNVSLSTFDTPEGNANCAIMNAKCKNVSNRNSLEDVESNTGSTSTERTVSKVVDENSDRDIEARKIPIWVLVTLGLSILCCIVTGFITCFYRALRKYLPCLGKTVHESLPTASTGVFVNTQHSDISGGMVNLDLLSTRHRSHNTIIRGAVTSEAIKDHGNLQQSQDVKVSGSFRTDHEALVHKQREPESHCFGHLPSKSTSNDGDLSGAIGFTKYDSEAYPDSPDSVYCSVDDIKGAPGDVDIDQLNSHAISIQHPSPSPKDQPHVQASFSASVRPGKIPRNSSSARLKKAAQTDADMDLLYSKPDMSRKTNRIRVLESDYDDPRSPGLDLGLTRRCKLNEEPNILEHDKDCGMSLTDLYENNIANPTDELVDDEGLYVNY